MSKGRLGLSIAIVALMAIPAHAQSSSELDQLSPEARLAAVDALCATDGELASVFMDMRQRRMSMAVVMSSSLSAAPDDPEYQAMIRAMIIAAYDIPAFSGDEMKQEAIDDFGNEATLACYRANQ